MTPFFCTYAVFREVASEFLELASLSKDKAALANGMKCLEVHFLAFDGDPQETQMAHILMKEALRAYINSRGK